MDIGRGDFLVRAAPQLVNLLQIKLVILFIQIQNKEVD
jgi:hypothetical protein